MLVLGYLLVVLIILAPSLSDYLGYLVSPVPGSVLYMVWECPAHLLYYKLLNFYFDMLKEKSSLRCCRFTKSICLKNYLMPTPCLNCKRSNCHCLVDLESGCCLECISQNLKCDLVVTL